MKANSSRCLVSLVGSATGIRFFTRAAQDVEVWVETDRWDVTEEIWNGNNEGERA